MITIALLQCGRRLRVRVVNTRQRTTSSANAVRNKFLSYTHLWRLTLSSRHMKMNDTKSVSVTLRRGSDHGVHDSERNRTVRGR